MTDVSPTNYLVCLQVRDTGIGMTSNEIDNLFSAFFQANTKHSRNGGTGLGLVITKKIVELMGGKITVTSEKGKGSVFMVTFPCKKSNEKEVSEQVEKSLSNEYIQKSDFMPQKKLILIVEDNLINQKVLRNYLEKRGYNYDIAFNGLEAVEKSKVDSFDLILMDIEMPLMNGLEATINIRSDPLNPNNKTPIIGLSGNSTKQQIDEAIGTGMNYYLTKPYHREDVFKVIEKYTT